MTQEPIDPATLIQDPPTDGARATAPEPPLVSRRGRVTIVVSLLVALLVMVLFLIKDNQAPVDLKVGDCFDIPSLTPVRTVTHHSCTDAHTAEVFLVVTYDGTDTSRPGVVTIDQFVTDRCDPAVKGYVGKALVDMPAIVIGYFYPSSDAWDNGDRTITCYVARADRAAMATSLRGSGGP